MQRGGSWAGAAGKPVTCGGAETIEGGRENCAKLTIKKRCTSEEARVKVTEDDIVDVITRHAGPQREPFKRTR